MTARSALWDPAVGTPRIFSTALDLQKAETVPEGLPEQRLGVVGSLTMDFAAKAIACAVYREGVFPRIYTGLFGAYVQESLQQTSELHRFKPHAVVIAPDWRDVVTPMPMDSTGKTAEQAIGARVDFFSQIWNAFAERGVTVYQHTLLPPPYAYRGIADRLTPAHPGRQVEAFTQAALRRAPQSVHWIDIDDIARSVGLANWAPNRFYINGRLPFDTKFLPQYMRAFGGSWRAANFRSKKALVVDLDNTLWGGVIGDDGVANIKLGPDTPAGEAFSQWGSYLSDLAERGVILAVCSKNSPEIARSGFTHPHSVLSLDRFAAVECSWEDKATMLRRIARTLNIGLDALVFADDNPAECELVRAALPEVGVVHLGDDPAAFIPLLEAEHWFDLPRYTSEDFTRSGSYAARQQAEVLQATATDMESYLASLAMTGSFRRATAADLSRIAQLELKTNQFNLTTRRYDEESVNRFARMANTDLFVFSLRDRFASHGIVSSMITMRENDDLRIDSWLMSCRVFSRTAECFIFRRLIEMSKRLGAKRIIGEFKKTERNGVVENLFETLGFSHAGGESGIWYFDLEKEPMKDFPDTWIKDEEPVATLEASVPVHNG